MDTLTRIDGTIEDTAFPAGDARGDARPALLMDLRPCYEGYAGIPQECRLLFAMFSGFRLKRFGGLASGVHFSSRRKVQATPTQFERLLEQTKAIIAQDTRRVHWPTGVGMVLPGFLKQRLFRPYLLLSEIFRSDRLDLQIDPRIFEDYLWTKLFVRTLAPKQRYVLQRAEYFMTELGHEYARSLSILPSAFQRRLNSSGWDVFFASGVSPYRVRPGTTMMLRYYDALPLLSPHTIGEPWPHAMSHARMLQRNMKGNARFYCGSEPVRQDLLNLFPQAEKRVHTIPVCISPEYYPEEKTPQEILTILRRRNSTKARGPMPPPNATLPKLVMAVSTLEPRKNYLALFRAFEMARAATSEPMRLLVVANKGWRSDEEMEELRLMVQDGAYHLTGVPTSEMRALYSAAHCVVAPSRAEGFDYCGVEAMACGTPVIASDIPVHRWVYGNAATYFDPYDEQEQAQAIGRFVALRKNAGQLAALRDRGFRQARSYSVGAVAPLWESALEREAREFADNGLAVR